MARGGQGSPVARVGIRAVATILRMTGHVQDVRNGGKAVVRLVRGLMGDVHMRRVRQSGTSELRVPALRRSHLRQACKGLMQRRGLDHSFVSELLSIRCHDAQARGRFIASRHAGRPGSETAIRTISPVAVTQLRLPLFVLDEVTLLLPHLLAPVNYLSLPLVFRDEPR